MKAGTEIKFYYCKLSKPIKIHICKINNYRILFKKQTLNNNKPIGVIKIFIINMLSLIVNKPIFTFHKTI